MMSICRSARPANAISEMMTCGRVAALKSYGERVSMAVMERFTLKTDPATYQALHAQMLALAMPAGMLFHSSHEAGGQVGIVDFWPDEASWNAFAQGPLAEGMK